jgi:hypothetical protein
MDSSDFRHRPDPGASALEAPQFSVGTGGRLRGLRAILGAWALLLATPALAQSFDATAREVFEGANLVTATDEQRCTVDVTDLNGASPGTIFIGRIAPARTRLSSVSLDGTIFSSFLFAGDEPVMCLRTGQCLNEIGSRIIRDEYDRKRLLGTLVHLFTSFCPGTSPKAGQSP